MIHVRDYTASDYPYLKTLLESSNMYDPTWDSEANLASIIETTPASIQIAQQDGQIVGVVIIDNHGDKVKFFYRLAVSEQHRGSGVGSALLQKAEAIAQEMGAQEIAVFVDSENTIIQRFYTMKGYQTTGKKFLCMYKKVDTALA